MAMYLALQEGNIHEVGDHDDWTAACETLDDIGVPFDWLLDEDTARLWAMQIDAILRHNGLKGALGDE